MFAWILNHSNQNKYSFWFTALYFSHSKHGRDTTQVSYEISCSHPKGKKCMFTCTCVYKSALGLLFFNGTPVGTWRVIYTESLCTMLNKFKTHESMCIWMMFKCVFVCVRVCYRITSSKIGLLRAHQFSWILFHFFVRVSTSFSSDNVTIPLNCRILRIALHLSYYFIDKIYKILCKDESRQTLYLSLI